NTGSLMKMMVLGRSGRIDAAEAHRIHLVDEVVPHAQLMERARELAGQIARNSPAAIEVSKRALFDATRGPYAESFWRGWDRLKGHWAHPEFLGGARAFAEKRAREWYVSEEGS